MHGLTPDEEAVIVRKGTEKPFEGEYDDFFADGEYVCRRCENPLYSSEAKFKSGCGWPAFDENYPDAVRRIPESDGRTELVCAKCRGHLGHVFEGERLTPRDVRHCVNSLSIKFKPNNNDETI